MNVLVVTPSYPSADDPHRGIFVHRQIAALARCGVRCRVLHVRPAPPRFPWWLRRRSWIRYYWTRRRWPRTLDGVGSDTVLYTRRWTPDEDVIPAMQSALVEWVDRHPRYRDTDVVYAQFLWTGAAAALALRDQFGWPVAAIARGGEMQQWHASNSHCRAYVEQVLRCIDQPLANCRALVHKAEQLVPGSAARLAVVYNGCDAEWFRPAVDRARVRRALGVADAERVAVLCGSIEPVKGIDELAAAWREFSRAHPNWRLVVIGRCFERSLATELRACGGRVTLTGELRTPDVVAWLQAADLYVQPSRLEGLANATMEAMAVGLPVISTNVGGQRELIEEGETGWLVPPGDPVRLRAAIDDAACRPDARARMGAAARCTIVARFDPRAQAARLREILARTAAAQLASCS